MSADAGSVQGLVAEMGRRDAQHTVRGLTVMGKQPVVLLTKVLAALEPGRHVGGQHPFHAVQCPWVACCGAFCQVCCVCLEGCMPVRELTWQPALLVPMCCMASRKLHRHPHVQLLCACVRLCFPLWLCRHSQDSLSACQCQLRVLCRKEACCEQAAASATGSAQAAPGLR